MVGVDREHGVVETIFLIIRCELGFHGRSCGDTSGLLEESLALEAYRRTVGGPDAEHVVDRYVAA